MVCPDQSFKAWIESTSCHINKCWNDYNESTCHVSTKIANTHIRARWVWQPTCHPGEQETETDSPWSKLASQPTQANHNSEHYIQQETMFQHIRQRVMQEDTGKNTLTFCPPPSPKHAQSLLYTCQYTHANIHTYICSSIAHTHV